MVNQQLINYIKNARKQKISYEEIKTTLRGRGWSSNDINEAFSQLPEPQKPRKKFLIPVIVIVGILVIGGGILAYQYWWLPKQEKAIIESLTAEKLEGEEEATSTISGAADKEEGAEQPGEALPEEEAIGQPEEGAPEKEIDITNWKTYNNEEYEFELKYPEDWTLKEKEGDEINTIAEIYPVDGLNCEKLFGKEICLDKIFIQVLDNEENLEIETLLSKFYEKWLPKNFQDLEIADRQGAKYDSYEPFDGSFQYNAAIETDDKVIVLTGSHLVDKEIPIYNQVLSSFTFIGTKSISEVTLSVDAPFSTTTLTIDYHGNIGYEILTSDLGAEKQVDTGKIASEQYDELANLIINNNFFLLEESYIEEGLTDATVYTITVKRKGETKSVTCYGECPQGIVEIREKIKELWGKEIIE